MSPRAAWRLESLGFDKVFDYVAGKLDWLSAGLPVEGTAAGVPTLGTVARRDVPTCKASDSIADVRTSLGSDPTSPCVVINDQRIVLGLVRSDAIKADRAGTVEEVMVSGPSTFRPNVSLEEIHQYLSDHKLQYALVTTSDGELIGMTRVDDVHRRLSASGAG